MSDVWVAWPPGCDPADLSRELIVARETFVSTGAPPEGVRRVVADSWRRSVASGVDPDGAPPPLELPRDDLREYRADHPLAAAMPVVRRLLVDAAGSAGLVVAVSDAAGRLLWVEGDRRVRSLAESIHFVAGANWDERYAGTNAPGTALAVNHCVQIFAAEHFASPVASWSCSAAPVHDPDTGALLGAIDVTGGDEVAAPHTLALVRATVAAVEAELRVHRLTGERVHPTPPARLAVLGGTGRLTLGQRSVELSPRHAELLLLLTEHPAGRTAEQLALALYPGEAAPVTVRAELSRLRALVPELALRSRPYRLGRPVTTDLAEARALLARGAPARALAMALGPVLPRSEAPAVVELRDEFAMSLRTGVLGTGDPALLLRYTRSELGAEDADALRTCLAVLPLGSPHRTQVAARLARLDAELGIPGYATLLQPSPR